MVEEREERWCLLKVEEGDGWAKVYRRMGCS
jgi:hypothetical protein